MPTNQVSRDVIEIIISIEKEKNRLKIYNETKFYEYISFCISNALKEHKKFKTEAHHILLRSVYPEFEDRTKNPWNIVILTYENHYIAHSLLALCSENKSCTFAWFRMNNWKNDTQLKQKLIGSKKYAELKEKFLKIRSQENMSEKFKVKIIQSMSKVGPDGLNVWQRNGLRFKGQKYDANRVSKIIQSMSKVGPDGLNVWQRNGLKRRGKPMKEEVYKNHIARMRTPDETGLTPPKKSAMTKKHDIEKYNKFINKYKEMYKDYIISCMDAKTGKYTGKVLKSDFYLNWKYIGCNAKKLYLIKYKDCLYRNIEICWKVNKFDKRITKKAMDYYGVSRVHFDIPISKEDAEFIQSHFIPILPDNLKEEENA